MALSVLKHYPLNQIASAFVSYADSIEAKPETPDSVSCNLFGVFSKFYAPGLKKPYQSPNQNLFLDPLLFFSEVIECWTGLAPEEKFFCVFS